MILPTRKRVSKESKLENKHVLVWHLLCALYKDSQAVTSGRVVAQDISCSSILKLHLLLSWKTEKCLSRCQHSDFWNTSSYPPNKQQDKEIYHYSPVLLWFQCLPPPGTPRQRRILGKQYRWQWPQHCGRWWRTWRASSTLTGRSGRQDWCGEEGEGTGTDVYLRTNQQSRRPGSEGRHCGPAGHLLRRGSALTEDSHE